MSTRTIFAAAVVTALIAPAPESAKALTGRPQATPGAPAAAPKSSRSLQSAHRNGFAQTSIPRVLEANGRVVGTDPDAAIRFQLRRDGGSERGSGSGSGGGSGGGGM